jgi:hypothetical protein
MSDYMSFEKAISSYTGKNGERRMNCAQSIVNGFKDECNILPDTIYEFQNYGGGRAPGGLCGAYYAAKTLLESSKVKDKIQELEQDFINDAGSVKCREIRQNRRLNCLGCVEKSSRYLDTTLKYD